MATIHEVGPDIFQVTTYIPDIDLQFSQFLVRDDEPLLVHTGMRTLFPAVHEAIAALVDPAEIRWIGFSHFEADECGALNEWLDVAPDAAPVCGLVGAMTSVDDFASRPARAMAHDEVLVTGKRRFRFRQTPHVPHCWDAGLLFEETTSTLFGSDLFAHSGDVEALVRANIIERTRDSLVADQQGPFANAYPYTSQTGPILEGLASLDPRRIATMHGSVYEGDGARALRDLAAVMREVLAPGA
jgi:flavorubredoxin